MVTPKLLEFFAWHDYDDDDIDIDIYPRMVFVWTGVLRRAFLDGIVQVARMA
jgi:hypothetical protein